jgi:hypothetical protein
MSTLNVTRALTTQTNPTEAQFDIMRTYLLNFFNSGNLDQTNVATGGMIYTKLGNLADDANMKFTTEDSYMNYDSSLDVFVIANESGDVVFGSYSGSLTAKMTLDSATGNLTIAGIPYFNQSVGSQEVSLLYLMSKYRKPRLQYTSSDVVTAEDNTNVAGTVVIMGRDRLWTLYDTTLSLAADANGYGASHTGTAVSGLLVADTRTANRWYYVYAVEVQYGTQNSGVYCILVATETSPETSNISTLNTAFGTGKWVYMGVIRNGYNDGTNTNVIVPFDADESGFTTFRDTTVTNEGKGVTLASSSDTADLEYTLVIGNSAAATIPPVASRVIFGGHRQQDGFELHYRAVATDENHAITGGCYHNGTISGLSPAVYMEVPLIDDYKVVIVGGATSTDKRITLAGFQDHYA